MYSILANAINHPDAISPYRGLFNHRIIDSLAGAGTSVDAVSPRPIAPPVGPYSEYASLPEIESWGAYNVHHPRFWYLLPKRLFYAVSGESYARRVPKYVDRTFDVPDVVHACHIYPDGYGMLPYVRDHDLPLFVVAHGALLNSYPDAQKGIRTKVSETLEAATGVLCVSDALAEKARSLVDPAKVHTVPIGANPDLYPVDRKATLRRELGIPEEATVVLFVGQFSERKGIPELAAVLPNLDAESTEFVFVGHGGDLTWDLREALWRSDFSNEHVYTGITSMALRRWFAVADLLVLPSRAEGRPTVIYEAMASETAVLASRVGGVPEQVVDGETGRLLPPGDEAALQVPTRAAVTDRPRLEEMGRQGRRRLLAQDWTWHGHANRVQQLHREALD
jgi:glycosyltransferase involved in cell wall biosynthesis